MHIVILLSSSVIIEFRVEVEKLHFYFSTTRKFHSSTVLARVLISFWVIFTWNSILVCANKISDHTPKKLHFFSWFRGHRWSEISQIILSLFYLIPNFLHNIRQTVLDMCEQNLRQLRRQIENTKYLLIHWRINRMSTKIQLLFFDCSLDRDSIHDILLWSIFDTNESQSQLNIFSFEHSLSISSLIHDINLGDNTNSSDTLWIEFTSHLKTIWCSHICVSGENT